MSEPRNGPTAPAARTAGEAGCLPPGYPLHEFVIDSLLGEGGFGVVYAATDTRLERKVAIKEYMPTSLATRDADFSVHARSSADHQEAFGAGLRSFVNEAKLLARFEHPALVKVYQFWEERGTAYMVMPLYTAPTFKRWVKQRKEPIEEVWLVNFLDGAIDALDALHRENCLHRDVAPDNILVLNEASPLLLDFGAARRVIGDMTHNLTVILKPGFAPIEQYAETSALKQGPWTDVYALCAVGYYAIAGHAPLAAVARMVNDEHVPLRQLAAGRYSPRLLAALDAGLRVRPEERPLSMAALRALLFGEDALDERTTIIASKAPPVAPLSPAPPQLHSTFKPKTDSAPLDEEATRVITSRATAQPAGRTAPAGAAPRRAPGTLSPSAAPTYKLPPRAPAAAPAAAAATEPAQKRAGPWLWVGSFALGGAALVLGVAWWIERPYPSGGVNAPVAQAPAVANAGPTAAGAPTQAPPAAASPAPLPTATPEKRDDLTDRTIAPAQTPRAPERAAAKPAAPPPAPPPPAPTRVAEPTKKSAPPLAAATPPTAKAPAEVHKPVDARKPSAQPRATEPAKVPEAKPVQPAELAKAAEPTKAVEAVKPAPPPVLRAPDGPPPLAVTDRGFPELQLAGTVDPKQKDPKFTAYTCCNLHYDGDWVSDLNYSTLPRIPAGTPIKVVDYGRWRIYAEIGGKKYRLGLDYGRSAETLAQFARKLTVDHDLRFRLAQFPPIVQDAIRVAKLLPGMTKEQVVISVGFPSHYETVSVNNPTWKYWLSSRVPYSVVFDAGGRVKQIEINPEWRSGVVYEPRKN